MPRPPAYLFSIERQNFTARLNERGFSIMKGGCTESSCSSEMRRAEDSATIKSVLYVRCFMSTWRKGSTFLLQSNQNGQKVPRWNLTGGWQIIWPFTQAENRGNWAYFCSMGSSFQDTGHFSNLPYLGMKLSKWPKFQKLHMYPLSTPGGWNSGYFCSTGSGFRDTGRFSKLPYLGIKLGKWPKFSLYYHLKSERAVIHWSQDMTVFKFN